MGNCLRSNKVLAEDQDDALIPKEEEAVKEETQQAICSTSSTPSKLESAKEGKRKKVVRFKLPEDEEENEEENKENINNNISSSGDSNRGAVRIKLVLTREELKQVVDFMNGSEDDHSSSLQQLLSVIKSRGQMISEAGTSCTRTAREGLVNGSWRPVLESIAED